jgi:hypothetical protein
MDIPEGPVPEWIQPGTFLWWTSARARAAAGGGDAFPFLVIETYENKMGVPFLKVVSPSGHYEVICFYEHHWKLYELP